jgi:predicted nucleic acid-binding protein
LTVTQGLDQVQEWLDLPGSRIVQESDNHWEMLRDLIETTGTVGNRATDAHLAALAITHRATLVSCDSDFLRFRALRWENPLAKTSNGR